MAQEITGHILTIQEERIRIQGDDGRAYLLTLAHNAEADNLEELRKSKAHVLIHFDGEADLDSGVAHSVRRLQ